MNAKPVWEPVEILVTQFLYPGDQYYELQNGGGFCTKSYLDLRRQEVEAHELKHHEDANRFWGGDGGRKYESQIVYAPTATEIEPVADSLQAGVAADLQAVYDAWDIADKKDFTCLMRLTP